MLASQFERLTPSRRDSQREEQAYAQLRDQALPEQAKRAERRRKAGGIAKEIAKLALDVLMSWP